MLRVILLMGFPYRRSLMLHKLAITSPVLWIAPGSGALRGGATWACGVFGKMPRRRQGMRQPLYVEISNQGSRVERCHARLHYGLSDRASAFPGSRPKRRQ
jgi:hypothetical protein